MVRTTDGIVPRQHAHGSMRERVVSVVATAVVAALVSPAVAQGATTLPSVLSGGTALVSPPAMAEGDAGASRRLGPGMATLLRQADDGALVAQADDLAAVRQAVVAAKAYVAAQGFRQGAFKDALEHQLAGLRCYSVAEGRYYLVYGDVPYVCTGDVVSVAAAEEVLPSYDTTADARAQISALPADGRPEAFVTLGHTVKGDRGHAYYVRTAGELANEALPAFRAYSGHQNATPTETVSLDLRIDGTPYALASAEGALSIYQMGYQTGSDRLALLVDAFGRSSFRTLAFPAGDYLLTGTVMTHHDHKAFYGFGATIYTDDSFVAAGDGVLWNVRGRYVWGEGSSDGVNRDTYHTTHDQEYNGLAFRKPASHTTGGYRMFFRVRNATDVSFSHCSLVDEAHSLLCVDLYGNYENVTYDHVTMEGGGCLEIRDLDNAVGATPEQMGTHINEGNRGGGRNVLVRDCAFTTSDVDEGLPIFAGNEQGLGSWKDGTFTEYPILTRCLVENVVLERNTWTMQPPAGGKGRTLGITCGYQDSPVQNVVIRDNEFDVWCDYSLMLFGYADNVEFAHNKVTMHGITGDAWGKLFVRATHSRTGATTGVSVHDNTFELAGQRKLTRTVDRYLGEGALSFADNDVTVEGQVDKLLDSTAAYVGNRFHLGTVKSLYSHVRTVRDNSYEILKLGSLYEADADDAQADIAISREAAAIAEMTGNVMVFNNKPSYHGHSLTFEDCAYDIQDASSKYHYLAWSTDEVQDKLDIAIRGCSIPGFETEPHDTIPNLKGDVTLSVEKTVRSDAFSLVKAEVVLEGGGFADATEATTLTATAVPPAVGQLSGEVVGGFTIAGTCLPDAELSIGVATGTVSRRDVLELYRKDGDAWKLATYADVIDGTFCLATARLGIEGTTATFAVVDKSKGSVVPTSMPLASSSDGNNLRAALAVPGVYTATRPLSIQDLWAEESYQGAPLVRGEFHDLTILGPTTDYGITFTTNANADPTAVAPLELYFKNCTFDASTFRLWRDGTYVFDGCTFVNSPQTSVSVGRSAARVYVFNCTMRDNSPSLADWNANASSVRSWKYAALSLMSDDALLSVCGTTIKNYQTNPTVFLERGHTGLSLYFGHNVMDNCGGAGIVMNSAARGRIDHNRFVRIGGMRGAGGYAISTDGRWAVAGGTGAGVGGNAVYGFNPSYQMRVVGNTIDKVMENAIEGHYWCVDDNVIDMTGYRFDDGFDTVSTEAIWGYSANVRNNYIIRPHGAGILVNVKYDDEGPNAATEYDHDVVVSGNTIDKGGYGVMEDKDGVRVVAHAAVGNTITVTGNTITGFLRPTFTLFDPSDDAALRDKVVYADNVTGASGQDTHAGAGVYYVATDGSDTADGSLAHPFATIAHAISVMKGGDTLYVRGGTYREEIAGVPSGTSGHPTRICAYEAERVTLSAGEPISGWQQVESRAGGVIWSAPMDWDLRDVTEFDAIGNDYHGEDWTPQHMWYDNLVYVDGSMAVEGRWPNAGADELLDRDTYATAVRASGAVIKDDDLPWPDEVDLKGAEAWVAAGGGYTSVLANVTDHRMEALVGDSSGTLYPTLGIVTKSSSGSYMYTPTSGNYYYVTKSLATLDAEHEWYKDRDAKLLYLWEPAGVDPNMLDVEARRRSHVVRLLDASYVSIEGIDGRLGDVALTHETSHCSLTGARLDCLGHEWSTNATGQGVGVLLGGSDNLVARCEISNAFGAAVQLRGTRNRLVNNDIHDVGFEHGQTDAAIRVAGTNQLVSHNSVHHCMRGALGGEFEACEIAYNDFYDCMRVSRDGGVVYFNWHDYENSEFHHNLLHDTLDFPDDHMQVGLYLDSFTSSFVAYRNVVYGIQKADPRHSRNGRHLTYQFDPNSLHNVIVNNTFVNYRPLHLNFYPNQDLTGTVFYNNLFQTLSFIDGPSYYPWNWKGRDILANVGVRFAENIEGSYVGNAGRSYSLVDPSWTDPTNGDFTLRPDSSAIDAGRVISGVTDGYTGWAPDVGAYEAGQPWEAGCDLSRDYDDRFELHDIPYRNLVENQGFESRGNTGTDALDFDDWTETGDPGRLMWSSWGSWGWMVKQGSNSVVLRTSADSLTQHLSLKPNTTYRVGGYGFVSGAFVSPSALTAATRTDGSAVGANDLAALRKRQPMPLSGLSELRFAGLDFGTGRDRVIVGLNGGLDPNKGQRLSVAVGGAGDVAGSYEVARSLSTSESGWRWVTITLDRSYQGTQDLYLKLEGAFTGSLGGLLTDRSTSDDALSITATPAGGVAETITIDSSFKAFEGSFYAPHEGTVTTGDTGELELTVAKAGGELAAYADEIFLSEDPEVVHATQRTAAHDAPFVGLASAETQLGAAGFVDVGSDLTFTRLESAGRALLGDQAPVGTPVGAFVLAAAPTARLGYTEATLTLDPSLVAAGDVVELLRRGDVTVGWQSVGHYQVVSSSGLPTITFEFASVDDLGTFALVDRSTGHDGQLVALEGLSGNNGGDQWWKALRDGGAYVARADTSITIVQGNVTSSSAGARACEMHGAVVEYKNVDNGADGNGIIKYVSAADRPNDVYFEDCTFVGIGFAFYVPGTYTFVDCTFRGSLSNALHAAADGVRIYCYGCSFEDNVPHLATWNDTTRKGTGHRHLSYAAIRTNGDDCALHVAGCAFKNLQTDSTVIVQAREGNVSHEGDLLVFERNTMVNCGGAGLVLDSACAGRVDDNVFRQIGGTRGTGGYKSTINATLGEYDANGNGAPGAGVGGNAVFARGGNFQMRVRNNDIKDVMENGIEGSYHCISGNRIDTTGYRYDDPTGDSYNGGYKTVSTEGIAAAGTWYVTDNTAVNVHGRGIGVSSWNNHPVLVEGNTVSRRANGHPGDDTSEGIKIRTDENSWANVTVRDNTITGFLNNYRVLHANDADRSRTCENVSIADTNGGKLIDSVYSNLRGVKITTGRDTPLPFANGDAAAWTDEHLVSLTTMRQGDRSLVSRQGDMSRPSRRMRQGDRSLVSPLRQGDRSLVSPLAPQADDATDNAATDDATAPATFVRMVADDYLNANGDTRSHVWQTFDLPDQACTLCLEIKVRSSAPVVRGFVTCRRPSDGSRYTSDEEKADGGPYSESKVAVGGISPTDFTTQYLCLRARGTTQVGIWASEAGQTIDIASVRGWYAVDDASVGEGRVPVTATIEDDALRAAVDECLRTHNVTHRLDDAAKTIYVADVASVTELDLSNRQLKTIEGIQAFTALASLDISNNLVADLAPLSSLARLETLVAYGNRIRVVTPLLGLAKLEHLELAKNELVDATATANGSYTALLARLTNLTYLDLAHNLIRHTTDLNKLAKLEHLDLYDNAVHDLSGLAGMTSLTHLDLGENNEQGGAALTTQNARLDALDDLVNLTYLDFSRNASPEIVDHLARMGKLAFLQLQGNGITDVSKLAALASLETLVLNNNDLSGGDGIRPLYQLGGLRELHLRSTKLPSLADSFTDKDSLDSFVWPRLRTLDIAGNWDWTLRTQVETWLLWQLFQREGYQLAFRYDRVYQGDQAADYPYADKNIESLVKADPSRPNVRYVTYDDFGARHDGSFDDYGAMVSAHLFANGYQKDHPEIRMEVRGVAGATYHIFDRYNTDWNEIKTDVDWFGATIVIHDEDVENMSSRGTPLFVVRTLDGGVALDRRVVEKVDDPKTQALPYQTVGTSLKAGDRLPQDIVALFPKQADGSPYSRYVVEFYDESVRQHIRSGTLNANGGSAMYDGVIASSDGTLEHDIQWDFAKLTRLTILPIPETRGHVRNATFVTTGVRTKSEVPYHRGGGKSLYYYRNFEFQYTANLDVTGIEHRLGAPDDWSQAWDEVSGSYMGLFLLIYTADATVADSSLWGRKYIDPGRSTYDLKYERVVDVTFRGLHDKTPITDGDRWSVVAGNFAKHLTFADCVTNSAGTHESVYNFTIRDCDLGSITLCGNGLALVENTTVHGQYFANLRSDYGTTWTGELRVLNCRHVYDGRNRPQLVSIPFDTTGEGAARKQCDYGYETHFPNLYVQDLVIDYTGNARPEGSWNYRNGTYYVIPNSESLGVANDAGLPFVPASYWPGEAVVNGATFEGAETQLARGSAPVVRMTASNADHIAEGERNYLQVDVHVGATGVGATTTGAPESSVVEDVTARLFAGEVVRAVGPFVVDVAATDGATGSFRLRRTDPAGGEPVTVAEGATGGRQELACADAGSYELALASTTDVFGWQGERTLRFVVREASLLSSARDLSLAAGVTAHPIGIGGHGALFDPAFSPFHPDTIVADCDMSGLYVSHDAGQSWDVKSLDGRAWDVKADPSTPGVFYAGGGGLWRSTDDGDTWSMLWPDPKTVTHRPTMLNHTQNYYFSTDSYPDASVVEAICVDPQDPQHLLALVTPSPSSNNEGANSWRHVFESLDGGASFACLAQFQQKKAWAIWSFEHPRVFVEHGTASATSRVVIAIPDGIYEVDRTATDAQAALKALYEAPVTIKDARQVVDADGTHYVVLEELSEKLAQVARSRVRLWHTTDFSDKGKRVDLTAELYASLPQQFNTQADGKGENCEIKLHDVASLSAPSMDRMYLSYRSFDFTGPSVGWQGVSGLVTYDAGKATGSRFSWTYGTRLWWRGADANERITPDQNSLMARAHSDASFAIFDVACDPANDRRIAFTTHTGLMYSPDIDARVGTRVTGGKRVDMVNIYPSYATLVRPNEKNPSNVVESFMRSTGLEVTVVEHVATDPFDPKHLLIGMDDAGVAQSFDGGDTWSRRYTQRPSVTQDTCFDTVFDAGRQGVVYALWHEVGGSTFTPSATWLQKQSRFAISTDGGDTWDVDYSTGLPPTAGAIRLAVAYPRDASGRIGGGERTIYVATMGYGFYVSHDSGRTFQPMNAGIPVVDATKAAGTVDAAIWARDVMVTEDGRVFGMTQFSALGPKLGGASSATYHATQHEATFGNVWEWDAGAGTWVRLPLNAEGKAVDGGTPTNGGLQARQPRGFAYDAASRTLYVTAVRCIGTYETSKRWTNFGGGLYAYTSAPTDAVGAGTARMVDAASPLVGEQRNLAGVSVDADGRLWVAAEDGDVWYRDADGPWTQVCEKFFRICQGFDRSADGTLYLTTRGAGAIRLARTDAELETRVALPDARLYDAVVEQLTAQGRTFARHDATRTVTLEATELAKVTSLDLSNRTIASLGGLSSFAALARLDVSNNEISDLTPLAGLASLRALDASGNVLGGTDKLPELPALRELALADDRLFDERVAGSACVTSAIARLYPQLESLDLAHNLVRFTTGLAGLSELTHLDLFDNAIRDLSGLVPSATNAPLGGGLTKLAYLDLGENNERDASTMTGLDALGTLTGLTHLDFSLNGTPGVMGQLAGLTKLTFLQLQGNGVGDLTALANMKGLKTLILADNEVSNLTPLLGLASLEELNLQNNRLCYEQAANSYYPSLAGVFGPDGALVWPALKKLDLSRNWSWGMRLAPETGRLFELSQRGALELNYEHTRVSDYDQHVAAGVSTKLADLPHTDAADGTLRYVTYDDFGARADGSYDDFIAMRNAHAFANDYQQAHPGTRIEVRGTQGKTYHVFRPYDTSYCYVRTDVDWRGAGFVIHDEGIDGVSGRFAPLLVMCGLGGTRPAAEGGATVAKTPYDDMVTLEPAAGQTKLDWIVDTGTTSIKGLSTSLDATLAAFEAAGYRRLFFQVENSAKRQYVRYGSNGNGGAAQWDGFVATVDGALEHAVQWDFAQLTKAQILPVPEGAGGYVRGGSFVTTALASKAQAPYTRLDSGKPIYYGRNLDVRYCANIDVEHVTNTVDDGDVYSGSYSGFVNLHDCADVSVADCSFFARHYGRGLASWRSTYGLSLSRNVDVALERVGCNEASMLDDTRYGVIQTDHNKHVSFDYCTLNRIDAHEGVYDLAVTDCVVGNKGLTLIGQGPLTIERTTVKAPTFLSLRSDYGSTWDGEVRIVDCTHEYHGTANQCLMDFGISYDTPYTAVHDFGYPLRLPELYVENLTVDERHFDPTAASWKDVYYVVPNLASTHPEGVPASYWPKRVTINGLGFEHCDNVRHDGEDAGHVPAFRMTATTLGNIAEASGGVGRSYWAGDVGVLADGVDVTRDLLTGERERAQASSSVRLRVAPSAADEIASSFALTRDGQTVAGGTALDETWQETLTAPGSYELSVVSADAACGWTATRTFAFDIAGTHRLVPVPAVAATCERAGQSAYYVCEDCKKWFRDEEGLDEIVDHASVVVPALGHDWGEGAVTTQPTCTSDGATTFTCKNDATHTKTETIAALGHDWRVSATIRAATCTGSGIVVMTCAHDATHVKTTNVDPLGHDWGEGAVVTPATCERAGLMAYTCARDATHTKPGVIPALGHDWGEGVVVQAPTCTAPGVRVRVCTHDITHTVSESIAALGHSWGAWQDVVPATCESPGMESRTCERDATHVETRVAPATGHALVAIAAVPATCEEPGVAAHWRCANCGGRFLDETGATQADDETLATPPLGHDWGAGVAVAGATYKEPGVMSYTCRRDPEHTRVETIPPLDPAVDVPTLSVRGHVQRKGWQGWQGLGSVAGTTGEGLRLEAFELRVDQSPCPGGVEYRAYVHGSGWQRWAAEGDTAGTVGLGKPLEAVELRLTGELEGHYELWYRVHMQGHGWLGWTRDGSPAGAVRQGRRLEAMQVVLRQVGEGAPVDVEPTVSAGDAYLAPQISCRAHVQSVGWMADALDGETAGTVGRGLRLEALELRLVDQPFEGGVVCRAHVQTFGWLDWTIAGGVAGTTGMGRRLEAIEARLTGEMASYYDLWYRAHVQGAGWLGWENNGSLAGTTGLGRRVEAVQMVLLPKGSSAPAA